MKEYRIFGADWCAPCKALKKEISQFDNVVFLDVMEYSDLHIKSVPTMHVYENDEQVDEVVGSTEIKNYIKLRQNN